MPKGQIALLHGKIGARQSFDIGRMIHVAAVISIFNHHNDEQLLTDLEQVHPILNLGGTLLFPTGVRTTSATVQLTDRKIKNVV